MKKSTKALLAGGVGAALLLGGAGSLAYWDSTLPVDQGGTITAGDLAIDTPDCGAGWTLDGAAFDLATDKVAPGDVLTKTCTFTLTASAVGLHGTVTAATPGLTGGLAASLTSNVVKLEDTTTGTDLGGVFSHANDGHTLAATVSVTFPYGTTVDNTSKKLTAVLSAVSVVAQQTQS